MQCHKNSHYCVYTVAGFGMKRWRQGNLLGEKDNVTNCHMSASLLKLKDCFCMVLRQGFMSLVWEWVEYYTSRSVTWMRIIKTNT